MRLSLLLFLAGCAAAPQPRPTNVELGEVGEAPTPVESAAPKPTEASSPGTLSRAELESVLDAAPGAFLQHVDAGPRLVGGRFHGWRLRAFYPGDARFAGVDLRAGDVILRVNGRSIEQPDELMVVWEALRKERELVVDLERDGRGRTLRWTIVDR
jgi:type II secretory pathway component PulC